MNRGGVDPVDAVRMSLRIALFGGEDMPEWRWDAACAEIPPDLFFAEPGETHTYSEAKRVCRGCPVRDECLTDVLSWERPGQRHGVVAGLTANEREQLVRARRGGAA